MMLYGWILTTWMAFAVSHLTRHVLCLNDPLLTSSLYLRRGFGFLFGVGRGFTNTKDISLVSMFNEGQIKEIFIEL